MRPAAEVRVVDIALDLEPARARLDADEPEHLGEALVGVGDELLVAHHVQVGELGGVLEQQLVAMQPVLDQRRVGHPLPQPPRAPELARRARDRHRMAHEDDHARRRERAPAGTGCGSGSAATSRPAPAGTCPSGAPIASSRSRRLSSDTSGEASVRCAAGSKPNRPGPPWLLPARYTRLQVLALVLPRARCPRSPRPAGAPPGSARAASCRCGAGRRRTRTCAPASPSLPRDECPSARDPGAAAHGRRVPLLACGAGIISR